jgi:hypothetical protein
MALAESWFPAHTPLACCLWPSRNLGSLRIPHLSAVYGPRGILVPCAYPTCLLSMALAESWFPSRCASCGSAHSRVARSCIVRSSGGDNARGRFSDRSRRRPTTWLDDGYRLIYCDAATACKGSAGFPYPVSCSPCFRTSVDCVTASTLCS